MLPFSYLLQGAGEEEVCVCGVRAWGEVTCGQCIHLTGALIVHKRGLGFVGGDIR